MLVEHFLQRLRRATGKRDRRAVLQAALQLFMDYAWPGNVRELKSALEYAFVVADTGKLDVEHLPPQFAPGFGAAAGSTAAVEDLPEKSALIEALRRTNGNQTQAARLLGINRVTVWNRIRKHGIDLKKPLQA